jgi:hypothetical protein
MSDCIVSCLSRLVNLDCSFHNELAVGPVQQQLGLFVKILSKMEEEPLRRSLRPDPFAIAALILHTERGQEATVPLAWEFQIGGNARSSWSAARVITQTFGSDLELGSGFLVVEGLDLMGAEGDSAYLVSQRGGKLATTGPLSSEWQSESGLLFGDAQASFQPRDPSTHVLQRLSSYLLVHF